MREMEGIGGEVGKYRRVLGKSVERELERKYTWGEGGSVCREQEQQRE